MKKWNKPEVEVIGVEETQHGADTITVVDGTYVDAETGKNYNAYSRKTEN